MVTLQSVTRSQFFLEYNINYTNVSNFLIWYKSDFAKLMNKEIETLKAKVLKLPTMSMEMFDNILENIDKDYLFSLSAKLILASLILVGVCVVTIGIIFIWYKRKASPYNFHCRKPSEIDSFLENTHTELFVAHIIRTDILTK